MTDHQPSPPQPAAASNPDGPDKNDSWSIHGVLLSRKIDVVAFAAFFLSISTILIQFSAWFKGADLKLLPPDQVFFWKDENYSDRKPRARFGATLIYVNKGDKGYAAIVSREIVHVTVAGKDFEQGWDKFVTFSGFMPTKDEPAKPFSVDGGDSESHQTNFIPWPRWCPASAQGGCNVQENHIHWDVFINELRRLVQAGQREFGFRFVAQVIDGKPSIASCKIAIDTAIVAAIDSLGGYNPTCFDSEVSRIRGRMPVRSPRQ
jgi:hypothetical protein